jgi:hypothetical protein
MHFCFLDHLHLSTGLKVVSPLQSSPCFSLNSQISPWFSSPPLLPPCVLLLCSAPLHVWCFCRRRNAPLLVTAGHLLCHPCPRVILLSPTAQAPPLLAPSPRATAPVQSRTPESLPPPQNPRGQALSPPLFCSMTPAARRHSVRL